MELWQQILLAEETARIKGQQSAPVQQQPAPQPQVVVKENVRYRSLYAYDANGNITYIGESNTGTSKSAPTWRIKQLSYDTSGNITEIRWANGDQQFNKIWENRTGYTYS
jgi:YD repeat-containing protein